MFKVIATDVVISKGYDGAPALKFSENGESVRFRIGKKVYDTRAENNTRWVNLSVKAFGPVCERIKKMQLKESSFINILGRLDEDVWEDSTTHEKRSAMVVILDEIEYCSSGGGKQKTEEAGEQPRAAASWRLTTSFFWRTRRKSHWTMPGSAKKSPLPRKRWLPAAECTASMHDTQKRAHHLL
jgi:single-strand DNA-binding protein